MVRIRVGNVVFDSQSGRVTSVNPFTGGETQISTPAPSSSTSRRSGGGGGGGGGSSGGGGSTPITTRETAKNLERKGFTGKVEEFEQGSTTPSKTSYYYRNRIVGGYRTGGSAFISPDVKEARFEFANQQGLTQFHKGGIDIYSGLPKSAFANYIPDEVYSVNFEGPPFSKETTFNRQYNQVGTRTDLQPQREFLLEKPIAEFQPIQKERGFLGLKGIRQELGFTQSKYETQAIRGEINPLGRGTLFLTGVNTAILDQFFGISQLIAPPEVVASNLVTGFTQEAGIIGQSLKGSSPEYALGRIGGFYAGAKGIELIGKAPSRLSDIYRTKGLIEIPAEDIIAPEYFKGQKYPLISRGETAGQLLKEFKPIKQQYGVTELKGFSASPKPFQAETTAGAGTSELAGVYQAPKLSPAFLKVASEEKTLFQLSPFETFRPSAIKITPTEYKLTPFVKTSQRYLAPLKPTKEFFYKGAELGKSYIPFVKTEKESVISMGTPLTLRDTRFFFKFEKRRIPILEFDIGNLVKVSKVNKVPKFETAYLLEDVYKTSSSSKIGRKGQYSPLDVSRGLRSSKSLSYSGISYSALSSSSSSLGSYKSYPSKSYYPYKTSYGKSYRGYSSSSLRSYSKYYGGYGGSYSFSLLGTLPPTTPFKKIIELPIWGEISAKDRLSLGKKYKRIPSFGAVILYQELGIKLPKLSVGAEESGLFERAILKFPKINWGLPKKFKKIKLI